MFEGSRNMRDFAPQFDILMSSKGVRRFKSGAHTVVREHFEAIHNAAIGH